MVEKIHTDISSYPIAPLRQILQESVDDIVNRKK